MKIQLLFALDISHPVFMVVTNHNSPAVSVLIRRGPPFPRACRFALEDTQRSLALPCCSWAWCHPRPGTKGHPFGSVIARSVYGCRRALSPTLPRRQHHSPAVAVLAVGPAPVPGPGRRTKSAVRSAVVSGRGQEGNGREAQASSPRREFQTSFTVSRLTSVRSGDGPSGVVLMSVSVSVWSFVGPGACWRYRRSPLAPPTGIARSAPRLIAVGLFTPTALSRAPLR